MDIKKKFKATCFLVLAITFLTNFSAFTKPKPHRYYAIIHSENNRYKGLIENVSDLGITIDHLGQSKFISADFIQKIKIKRSSALQKYALIGSAGGLIAGAVLYQDGHQKGKLSVLSLPVMLIAGTLGGSTVGALINTITSVEKYQINSPTEYKNLYQNLTRFSAEKQTLTN
jgi:hypothetical protein